MYANRIRWISFLSTTLDLCYTFQYSGGKCIYFFLQIIAENLLLIHSSLLGDHHLFYIALSRTLFRTKNGPSILPYSRIEAKASLTNVVGTLRLADKGIIQNVVRRKNNQKDSNDCVL